MANEETIIGNTRIQMARLEPTSPIAFRRDEKPVVNSIVWARPGNADWRLCLEVVYLSDGFVDYVALSEVSSFPGDARKHYEIVRDE